MINKFLYGLVSLLVCSTLLAGDVPSELRWTAACTPVSGYKLYYGVVTDKTPTITTETICDDQVESHYVYNLDLVNVLDVGNVTNYVMVLSENTDYAVTAIAYDDAGNTSNFASFVLYHTPSLYVQGGRLPLLCLTVDSYRTNWFTAPLVTKNSRGMVSTNYFNLTVNTVKCAADLYIPTYWTIQKSVDLNHPVWTTVKTGSNSVPKMVIPNDSANAFFRLKIGS